MKFKFYINFDLGLRGDYKGLYRWLDKNKAEERGNGYALIKDFDFPDTELKEIKDSKGKNLKFIEYLKNEIKEFVKMDPGDRIYLTFNPSDSSTLGGIFLFGNKQATPWEGFYLEKDAADADFES